MKWIIAYYKSQDKSRNNYIFHTAKMLGAKGGLVRHAFRQKGMQNFTESRIYRIGSCWTSDETKPNRNESGVLFSMICAQSNYLQHRNSTFCIGGRAFSTTSAALAQQNDQETASLEIIQDTLSNIDSFVTADTVAAGTDNMDFVRTGWPSDYVIDAVLKIHELTGCGYAASVVGLTLGLRVVMFPLFVKSQRNTSRMAHVKPELDVIKARVDSADDLETKLKLQKQIKALFKKYDVNPFGGFALAFVQFPIFMSMFFGLQRMPEYFPNSLSQQKFLWVTDLGISDPTFGLPLLTTVSFLAIVEAGKSQMLATAGSGQGETMLKVMRGLGVLMLPFTAYFPSLMFTYWLPNNIVSVLQSMLFSRPSVRKTLGIWDPPKPVPGAPKPLGFMEEMRKTIEQAQKIGEKKAEAMETKPRENLATFVTPSSTNAQDNHKKRLQKIRGAVKVSALRKKKGTR